MNELLLSVGSLVVGVVASIWVSAYYFRRSLSKSLTPYIQYCSSPFSGMDPSVKGGLKVTYQGTPVDDLFEIQFLVANTGDKAIRDVIEPLGLDVPEGCSLLDASIIHRNPEELRIELVVSEDRRHLTTSFPLLNSQDFFIIRLLLNGTPKLEGIKFTIVVDELPPTLKPKRLGFDDIATTKKREFELPLFGLGLAGIACGVAELKVVYDFWYIVPGFSSGLPSFLSGLGLSEIAVIVSVIPALLFVFVSSVVFASSFSNGRFPSRNKKFIVPESIKNSHVRFLVNEQDF